MLAGSDHQSSTQQFTRRIFAPYGAPRFDISFTQLGRADGGVVQAGLVGIEEELAPLRRLRATPRGRSKTSDGGARRAGGRRLRPGTADNRSVSCGARWDRSGTSAWPSRHRRSCRPGTGPHNPRRPCRTGPRGTCRRSTRRRPDRQRCWNRWARRSQAVAAETDATARALGVAAACRSGEERAATH